MADKPTLSVEIVDYAGLAWSGLGHYVDVPTIGGPVGIYPRHQPMMTLLSDGEVKIVHEGSPEVKVQVAGGFLSVDSDIVTIVTDQATVVEASQGGHQPAGHR